MLENAKKITVIGGGIWGQTLANLARLNHLAVRVWSRHTGEDLGAIIADTEVIISAVYFNIRLQREFKSILVP